MAAVARRGVARGGGRLSRADVLTRRPAKIAAPSASRYVSRAAPVSSGSSRLAASSSNGGASLPRREREHDLGAQTSRVWRAEARPAGKPRRRLGALAQRPALQTRASPVRRQALGRPRRAESGVSSAARSRNAAAAAMPPRACARPAERSSSSATDSSRPEVARARCQARRSGSDSGSVASASARCTSWRSTSGAAW